MGQTDLRSAFGQLFALPGYNGLNRADGAAVDPSQNPQRLESTARGRAVQDAAAPLVAQFARRMQAAFPDYQYSEPIVCGGLTTALNTPIRIPSEFTTICQYCVLTVAFQDAGSIIIGQDPGVTAPINTTVIDPSQRLRGQIYSSPGMGSVPCSEFWLDLPAGGILYMAVQVASSHAAYVSVQFRRCIDHTGVFEEGYAG